MTDHRLYNIGMRKGSIGSILRALSPDQRKWVIDETVKLRCTTVSEFITEVIRDAYEEKA